MIKLFMIITVWDHFLIKNLGRAKPRFCVISGQIKNLFSTSWYLHKRFMYHIKTVIVLQRFLIVVHSYAAFFSIKTRPDKTNKIFWLKN